jgi:hypothetical protein
MAVKAWPHSGLMTLGTLSASAAATTRSTSCAAMSLLPIWMPALVASKHWVESVQVTPAWSKILVMASRYSGKLMTSIEDSSTRYSTPSWSTGTVSPLLDSTCWICTASVFHCRPMGLPVLMAREAAEISPSGAWPDWTMPSRLLRII